MTPADPCVCCVCLHAHATTPDDEGEPIPHTACDQCPCGDFTVAESGAGRALLAADQRARAAEARAVEVERERDAARADRNAEVVRAQSLEAQLLMHAGDAHAVADQRVHATEAREGRLREALHLAIACVLHDYYPAAVFTGESGDSGAQTVVALRAMTGEESHPWEAVELALKTLAPLRDAKRKPSWSSNRLKED